MTTLKGIFPNPKPTRRKNFIHENVKNLRRMEQFFHMKEVEDLQKLQLQKKTPDKYRDVGSRINSSLRGRKHSSLGKSAFRHSDKNLTADKYQPERKLSVPMDNKQSEQRETHTSAKLPDKTAKPLYSEDDKSEKLDEASSSSDFVRESSSEERHRVMCRNQGIQTLDTTDMETLYREGAIRYPSSRSSKNMSSPSRGDTGQLHRDECESPEPETSDGSSSHQRRGISSDRTDPSPVNDEPSDGPKFNKQKTLSLASKFASQLNNGILPSNYRKGVVPKYIRERKEALQQKEEKMKAAAVHPHCPDGHVPLPDDERKETLRMLKKHHQEYVNELNMMPIKTDTLRSQRRKMEIEKQLNKLEEGIKVFSRPKVYVKVNA